MRTIRELKAYNLSRLDRGEHAGIRANAGDMTHCLVHQALFAGSAVVMGSLDRPRWVPPCASRWPHIRLLRLNGVTTVVTLLGER